MENIFTIYRKIILTFVYKTERRSHNENMCCCWALIAHLFCNIGNNLGTVTGAARGHIWMFCRSQCQL